LGEYSLEGTRDRCTVSAQHLDVVGAWSVRGEGETVPAIGCRRHVHVADLLEKLGGNLVGSHDLRMVFVSMTSTLARADRPGVRGRGD
jgi:hypothetical protein